MTTTYRGGWRSLPTMAALTVLLASLPERATTSEGRAGLVVHEWGTFTSVLGDDGLPLMWRPFTAADDLPGFVYRLNPLHAEARRDWRSIKTSLFAPARLETPVLYFYADEALSVAARVRFPGGRITEWYPQATLTGEGIGWDAVEVLPGASGGFPDEGTPNHYYAARETDAAPLRVEADVGPQEERFLFYRGAGNLELSVRAVLEGDRVVARALHAGVREIVLFENRGGRVGYSIQRLEGRRAVFTRPLPAGDVSALESELEAILVRHGLYPREAAAMVATWGGSWFEEGTRLFYVLPRALTDRALPLTVSPRPAELVRVLVGRLELILREDEDRVRAELDALPDATALTSAEKEDFRIRRGRFGEPTLRRLSAHTRDRATRAKIEVLLAP